MSPKKKKLKLIHKSPPTPSKRENEDELSFDNKRRKLSGSPNSDNIASLKRKNFIKACEKVSYSAYRNYAERYQLVNLPNCLQSNACKHQNEKESCKIKQILSHVEASFKIEKNSNMWCDALEVCRLSITPTQYLSSDVLKDVVEIILNAHEDNSGEYPISNLINQCQQILALNFSTHPPCIMNTLRTCYTNFLISPMDLKENTFTNRAEFECDKGIVRYCMNRLEYDISEDSKDTPLVDKNENIPNDMKQTVKGEHWQKTNLEIFETLERTERIDRLMAVLFSIIELLQYDLSIWLSRYSYNLGTHIMRSHRPLMASVFWAESAVITGTFNKICRQIFKLFVYFIHLKYPEEYIKIMQLWVNIMIQVFYICENNSNNDYPHSGKYCNGLAGQFHIILLDMPPESRIRILERIQPSFMRYLIGLTEIQSLFSTNEPHIITILINVLENSQWKKFPQTKTDSNLRIQSNVKNIKHNKFLKYLSKKMKESKRQTIEAQVAYLKYTPCTETTSTVDQNYVLCILSITFQAYLDAYSVENVQKTLDQLNEDLVSSTSDCVDDVVNSKSYAVNEDFIKGYRELYRLLKELIILLNKYRDKRKHPQILEFFKNISLLGL